MLLIASNIICDWYMSYTSYKWF